MKFKIVSFILLIVLFFLFFYHSLFITKEEHTIQKLYHAGFMYWYGTTPLREKWDLVFIGTVIEVKKREKLRESIPLDQVYTQNGTIKIENIVYLEGDATFDYELLTSNAFKDLKLGDKVMVLLIEYEGKYAIGNFHGGGIQLGIKLKKFNDPIVLAMKRFLVGYDTHNDVGLAHILEKDTKIWEKYDNEKLIERLELLKHKE